MIKWKPVALAILVVCLLLAAYLWLALHWSYSKG